LGSGIPRATNCANSSHLTMHMIYTVLHH
jgi:hypothetical protein